MDVESDDSDRWEDFFGSTTELAPSLLGIYDSLTSRLSRGESKLTDVASNIDDEGSGAKQRSSSSGKHASPHNEPTLHHSVEVEEYEVEEKVVDLDLFAGSLQLDLPSSADCVLKPAPDASNSHSLTSNKLRESPTKPRSNIRILSPNVQRIITHLDTEPTDIEALQPKQPIQSPLLTAMAQQRSNVKKPAAATLSHGPYKTKLSHIPLSRVTGKLTQSGNELVGTFDSSIEYLDALNLSQGERSSSRKCSTPASTSTPAILDDEVTPTNPRSPFNFDLSAAVSNSQKLSPPKQESLKSAEMGPKDTEQEQQLNGKRRPPSASSNAKEFVATEPLDTCDMVEAINLSLVSRNIAHLGFVGQQDTASIEIATNNSGKSADEMSVCDNKPVISKPLVRSVSAACASTISGSPLLTYARSKSLAAKANTLGGAVPIKLPTAEQLAELEEASQLSAESLDRLMDIKSKFSPKESRKMSGLMLPDIAKLKHRPLSSSSICSTSSSSSSSSDQLNGKLMTTSYLASVESLADQSESELLDPHSGMSVFERACLEIVDSERSYVEDLGQVIRGYLLDWKERACLRYDELRILFANIEEIYDFNSTLLKQLINSASDPIKIAKCFIDLRERFDVYTTYCTSYPEVISLLTRLLQATHTNALLTSTQKMLQHTLPLGSYLLKPVQRILKYHLLLDNLRKHCDVKEVFQAHEIMRQVARNIDQVKRKLEQQSRVKELSGILDGWLGPELTVLGELRQEGLLLEHNKPRMVFLFGTMLIITKPKEDNRLQFKSYIHQNNLMLSEHLPGEPTSFYVIPYDEPRNQIKLAAKNRDQKRLWAQHIKGVILEKFDNIPNRAKELVYKLGYEEDRTPDKNIWKWSLHSTSTPVYLERRNQYRRSEMRNRSKIKRKTLTNSSSFDSFNEAAESVLETTHQTLPQNTSMDDSMLPALQKLAAVLKTGKNEQSFVATAEEDCRCGDERKCERKNVRRAPKSPIFGKALKERSKSVPRISVQTEEFGGEGGREPLHGSNTDLDSAKSKPSKTDIKQYSAKMIPQKIVTLKKQKSVKKETSKFYMDLDEFESNTQTVLKITESSESLAGHSDTEPNIKGEKIFENMEHLDVAGEKLLEKCHVEEALTPAEKAKKDAQIILELLQNNKEFERLPRKQKKRPHENLASTALSAESLQRISECDIPPRPPSQSPPPLESENEAHESAATLDEPIYESLLRNVHVPYKFSPVLGRCNSMTAHYELSDNRPHRPESDYVTLIYSNEGTLQQVGNDAVERGQSDSNINYDPAATVLQEQRADKVSSSFLASGSVSSSSSCSTLKRDNQSSNDLVTSSSGYLSQISSPTMEAIYARPMPRNLMKRFLSSATATVSSKNLDSASPAGSTPLKGRKSIESLALSFPRCNRPPERRVSDVIELCRQTVIHRQGSESVGERMAHVDYADPRALFSMMSANSCSDGSLPRDSVCSLISSNDSDCEPKRNGGKCESSSAFAYEESVEASLENDFRDSAIYSDDNDKRPESQYIKRPSSPPPPPPTRNRSHPQVPPKPPNLMPTLVPRSPVRQMRFSGDKLPGPSAAKEAEAGAVVVGPTQACQSSARSWVQQQIGNFSK